MATEVGIANLALSRLGQKANVSSLSPPEGSAEAQHCAVWLPMARDALLSLHTWSFATVRSRPAERALSDPDLYAEWSYVYARPNNCLRILAVLPTGYVNQILDAQPFGAETAEDGTDLILTNTPEAILRWIKRVTNPAVYSPVFVEALSFMLASALAGPILKGEEGRKAALEHYNTAMSLVNLASGQDAMQSRLLDQYLPVWLTDR